MVFGRVDEEEIGLNEDTYWSGGPYFHDRDGRTRGPARGSRLIFDGDFVARTGCSADAPRPTRRAAEVPVARVSALESADRGDVLQLSHELDLDTAIAPPRSRATVRRSRARCSSRPVAQVLVVRLTADARGRIALPAQFRGARNQAHSNYATDYFRWMAMRRGGLVVRGKSADYLGVPGALRYVSRLGRSRTGRDMRVEDDVLVVERADAVTLIVAAATNFVSYKDVSADAGGRVDGAMRMAAGRLFRPCAPPMSPNTSACSAACRSTGSDGGFGAPDRRAAQDVHRSRTTRRWLALLFHFGRYLLISSSRPGDAARQPAGHLEPPA